MDDKEAATRIARELYVALELDRSPDPKRATRAG
jgi:hypothetical protein